jgi:acetyltransferase-like isoleucine patch superfamily enzyme
VNTGAIIDHETMVGDYAHIAPGCRVAGRVRIGAGAMLGIGTCVRDKQVIGTRAMVGAGSVVVDDIPNAVIAYGAPARVIRPRTP